MAPDALPGTPTTERAPRRDAGADVRFVVGDTSLGLALVAISARGVVAIAMADGSRTLEDELHERFPDAVEAPDDPVLAERLAQVRALLDDPGAAIDLPLDAQGTPFQQRVWRALREIPSGETRTYADIALRLGAPGATRAVAGACGANRIAVAIPCHRVVRKDGGLSGYRWGVERKRALLARERGAHAPLFAGIGTDDADRRA